MVRAPWPSLAYGRNDAHATACRRHVPAIRVCAADLDRFVWSRDVRVVIAVLACLQGFFARHLTIRIDRRSLRMPNSDPNSNNLNHRTGSSAGRPLSAQYRCATRARMNARSIPVSPSPAHAGKRSELLTCPHYEQTLRVTGGFVSNLTAPEGAVFLSGKTDYSACGSDWAAASAAGCCCCSMPPMALIDRRRRPLSSASMTLTRTCWPTFSTSLMLVMR